MAAPAELTPAVTGNAQMPSAEGPTHPRGQVQAKALVGGMSQKISEESKGIYRLY